MTTVAGCMEAGPVGSGQRSKSIGARTVQGARALLAGLAGGLVLGWRVRRVSQV